MELSFSKAVRFESRRDGLPPVPPIARRRKGPVHRRTLANRSLRVHFATPGVLPGVSGKLMERPHERRRLPPLNALRAFEAAARHLNFSRAADELSVTPGAVSQQIQNLEDYVGAALFKRTPKGLLLTDAAQTALPALREAFDRLAEAASMLTAAVDGRRLTVSVAPSFAAKWLVPRLGQFEALHPPGDVWGLAGMELVDFASGEIDLAVRYGTDRYPGLEVIRLMQETVIAVASPD